MAYISKSYYDALVKFIDQVTPKNAIDIVIFLPDMEKDIYGNWNNKKGNGIISTSKNVFVRFGKKTLNAQTKQFEFIWVNIFGNNEKELLDHIRFIQQGLSTGNIVKCVKIVIHETTIPVNRRNIAWNVKWADRKNGKAYMKLIPDNEGLLSTIPIYRNIKIFFADEQGNFPPQAVDKLITEDCIHEPLEVLAMLKQERENILYEKERLAREDSLISQNYQREQRENIEDAFYFLTDGQYGDYNGGCLDDIMDSIGF